MTETSPVPPLTFMQTWGQLVWMSIVIAILGTIIWCSVGLLTAVAVSVMLACLELTMFQAHVLKKHSNDRHALFTWFIDNDSSIPITTAVSMTAAVIWVMLISVWMTFHAELCAVGATLLVIGQTCLSESIHRVAHKETIFQRRHLTTWIEPAMYAGAIIGVVCGIWLI